jgi:hypothetical protein
MADDPQSKLNDWINKPYAAYTAHHEKQRKLFDAMAALIAQEGGWVVSPPGQKLVRFEVPQFSSLPIRLAEKGFKLSYVGAAATRNTSAGIIQVDVIEVRLGK